MITSHIASPQPDPLPDTMNDLCKVDVARLPIDLPEPMLSFFHGTGPVSGLAIDENVGMLAVGNSAGGVGVFDLATGSQRTALLTDGFVWSLAFSPDGRHLIAVGLNGSMFCWDLPRGLRMIDGVVPGTQAQNGRPWLSGDGSHLAMMKVDGLMIWDVQRIAQCSQTDPVGCMGADLAFNQSADLVFLAAGHGHLSTMVSGEYIRKVNGGLQILTREEIRTRPIPTDQARRNRLWHVETRTPFALPESVARRYIDLASFASDRELVVKQARTVQSLDLVNGERIGPMIQVPWVFQHLEVEGDLVAVLGTGWLVVNWRTGELVAGRRAPKPDARTRQGNDPTVTVPRARTRRRRGSAPMPRPLAPRPMRIRLSKSGSKVVVSHNDGLVEVFDIDRCRPVAS